MAELNKKTLEHLAELGRLDLKAEEEKKLLKDLQAILAYFKELQKLDTENIEPMTAPRSAMRTGVPAVGLGSGTDLKNVFREDTAKTTGDIARGSEAFPETHEGYLKTPPVF